MSPPYLPTDFVQDIQSQYSAIETQTFWACEPMLKRFVSEGVADRWLGEQLGRLAAGKSDLGWEAKGVHVHRAEAWMLSLKVFEAPRRFIELAPYLAIYVPMKDGMAVDRYKLPPGFRNDLFDPNVRLESPVRIHVPAKVPFRVDSTQFAYDFHVSQPNPVVRFTSRYIQPMEWLFSKTTLHAWQASDADLHSTQLRVAAHVLGKIAHQTSLEPLLKLSRHPHHAVRWAAIQNLGRISRTIALVRVREAVSDPHPHIRRAAAKTLQQLNPKQ